MKTASKKVCLLGDFAVGKTSLTHRFVYDLFSERYLSTIGVKVSRKNMVLPVADDAVELTMLLWDLAGSEAFDLFRVSYMRGSAGALLVCASDRTESIDHLRDYATQMNQVSPEAKFAVVVNKSDLLTEPFCVPAAEQVAHDLNTSLFYTSAKTGAGVNAVFRHLGQQIL